MGEYRYMGVLSCSASPVSVLWFQHRKRGKPLIAMHPNIFCNNVCIQKMPREVAEHFLYAASGFTATRVHPTHQNFDYAVTITNGCDSEWMVEHSAYLPSFQKQFFGLVIDYIENTNSYVVISGSFGFTVHSSYFRGTGIRPRDAASGLTCVRYTATSSINQMGLFGLTNMQVVYKVRWSHFNCQMIPRAKRLGIGSIPNTPSCPVSGSVMVLFKPPTHPIPPQSTVFNGETFYNQGYGQQRPHHCTGIPPFVPSPAPDLYYSYTNLVPPQAPYSTWQPQPLRNMQLNNITQPGPSIQRGVHTGQQGINEWGCSFGQPMTNPTNLAMEAWKYNIPQACIDLWGYTLAYAIVGAWKYLLSQPKKYFSCNQPGLYPPCTEPRVGQARQVSQDNLFDNLDARMSDLSLKELDKPLSNHHTKMPSLTHEELVALTPTISAEDRFKPVVTAGLESVPAEYATNI